MVSRRLSRLEGHRRKQPVKRALPVGGDYHQLITQVIGVTHFALHGVYCMYILIYYIANEGQAVAILAPAPHLLMKAAETRQTALAL